MPNFTVSNITGNQIIISNLDMSNPLIYTLLQVDNDGIFQPVINYNPTPDKTLAAGASVTIDLISDGVYSLAVQDSLVVDSYYFLLDSIIKACDKKLMQKILCSPCDLPTDCTQEQYNENVYQLMKFQVLQSAIYSIYSKYVEDQAINILVTGNNNELATLSDFVAKANLLCADCQENSPCMNVWDSEGNPTNSSNCGCN